jgi:hypothetical protein
VPAQTILGQTVLLAYRIALVWAGGILFAVTVRALLPENLAFGIHYKETVFALSFNRVGFWTCIWAAVTVTILVVIRSMLSDFGIRTQP